MTTPNYKEVHRIIVGSEAIISESHNIAETGRVVMAQAKARIMRSQELLAMARTSVSSDCEDVH